MDATLTIINCSLSLQCRSSLLFSFFLSPEYFIVLIKLKAEKASIDKSARASSAVWLPSVRQLGHHSPLYYRQTAQLVQLVLFTSWLCLQCPLPNKQMIKWLICKGTEKKKKSGRSYEREREKDEHMGGDSAQWVRLSGSWNSVWRSRCVSSPLGAREPVRLDLA